MIRSILAVLVLAVVPFQGAAGQDVDDPSKGDAEAVLPEMASPALIRIGPCVGSFIGGEGLALTAASCLSAAMNSRLDAGQFWSNAPIDGAALPDGPYSLEMVYQPSEQAVDLGKRGVYPSHRLDFALIRILDGDGPVASEVHLPLAPNGHVGTTSFFLGLTDSLVTERQAAWPSGFPLNGTLAPASTSFYDLYNAVLGRSATLPGEIADSHPSLGTRLNYAVEGLRPVPSGTPLVTEHFEVIGIAVDHTEAPLPSRTIIASTDALLELLSLADSNSALLEELRQGTRTTKSTYE
ncbi:MAG: hypothetical protein HKN29_03985 [Rhodothermales bacterium]|nr:hypothetical protein [Rhodothermales bacterium]